MTQAHWTIFKYISSFLKKLNEDFDIHQWNQPYFVINFWVCYFCTAEKAGYKREDVLKMQDKQNRHPLHSAVLSGDLKVHYHEPASVTINLGNIHGEIALFGINSSMCYRNLKINIIG